MEDTFKCTISGTDYLPRLLEMGCLLHPHLDELNHTNRLILKLSRKEERTMEETFDLGKYYDRMMGLTGKWFKDKSSSERYEYVKALLTMKYAASGRS